MNLAGARPDNVNAEVLFSAGVAAVHLDPQRVHIKSIQGLLVVKRVEVDADEIIGADVVAPGN